MKIIIYMTIIITKISCYLNLWEFLNKLNGFVRMRIGGALVGSGTYRLVKDTIFGMGFFMAGTIICILNYVNIKRINKRK